MCARLITVFALAILGTKSIPVSAQEVSERDLLSLQSLDQRIADVSWRISAANAALCTKRSNRIGVALHNSAQYAPAYREAANRAFGFADGRPAILAIAQGAPAEAAGLKTGDQIVSIAGETVPPAPAPKNAKEDYASIERVMEKLDHLSSRRSTALGISRKGETMAIEIEPVMACDSRVEMVPSGQLNANSNGNVVQIYGKLMLWTKSDDELATVIAHEMAHNILEHNARIDREMIGTGLFSSLGRSGAKLRNMEREADRYGLFMVARAGYDYRIAPDFWRRLSMAAGLGGVWATTHPSAGNRAEWNQGIVIEIDRQKAAGAQPTP